MLDKYNVFDFSSEYKFLENYNIRTGINNVFDAFMLLDAPWISLGLNLPGEGRTFYLLLQNFN
jgi:Fe(3+) dicitrate transport protein